MRIEINDIRHKIFNKMLNLQVSSSTYTMITAWLIIYIKWFTENFVRTWTAKPMETKWATYRVKVLITGTSIGVQ